MPNQNNGDDSWLSRNEFFEKEVISHHAQWELMLFGMQNAPPNPHVVWEVLSDFYIRVFDVWQKIPKENSRVTRAYLTRMLQNAYTNYHRAKKRVIPTTELNHALEVPTTEPTDQNAELLDWCWQIAATFKSDDQVIFNLKYLEGKKEREIAELTGLSLGTISVKIKRMLDKLRKAAQNLPMTSLG